jgi:hypothetical protein
MQNNDLEIYKGGLFVWDVCLGLPTAALHSEFRECDDVSCVLT